MPTTPYKVLIIGCGNIAGGFDVRHPSDAPPFGHAKAYLQHGGFSLVACVEPDASKRAAFQEQWGITQGANTLADLQPAPGSYDVISICSPTSVHAADLEAALALKPRLIFCEKPVTPSLAQTSHWVQRCEAQQVALAVNHSRRWAPDVRRLREQITSGHWGAIRAVTGFYNKGVLNNGSHMIDLLHYLFGSLTLDAVGQPVNDFFADDPSVPATLRSAQGVPISLNVAHASDYALFELQIVAEKGLILMEDGGANWRVRHVVDSPLFEGYQSLDTGTHIAGEVTLAMRYAIADIFSALSQKTVLASTGNTAMRAQQLCEQIRSRALPQQASHSHHQQVTS